MIIALSDLSLSCRPRCLDILEQDNSPHAPDGLLGLLLRAYGSRPSCPIYQASITLHQAARICAPADLLSKTMRASCHSRLPTALFFFFFSCSRTVHSDLVGLCRHWADILECHKFTAVVAPEAGLGLVIVGAPLSLSFLSMSLPRPVHNNTPTRVQQPYDVGPHRKQGIQGSPPPSHCTLHACLRRLEYGISNYPCLLMTSSACATIFLSGKLPLISSTLRR